MRAAVKDTYGKVIEYDGEVIIAIIFYFLWLPEAYVWGIMQNAYLNGKLMVLRKREGAEAEQELEKKYQDLSTEESFKVLSHQRSLRLTVISIGIAGR